MKRRLHSSSPPSSPLSSLQMLDDTEPMPKRPRIFVSSPTPPPEDDSEIEEEEEEEEEIIIDEPVIPSVTITEDSQSEDDSDDDDIIEIEQQTIDFISEQPDNAVIVVSDSDSDDDNDDQGIDVTDDIIPSVSSLINASIFSPFIEDIEIVSEELALMDEEEEEEEEEIINEDEYEFLEIMTNDDDDNNNNNDELIDLTEDEPIPPIPCSSISSERKLSVDVQQCPICLETLSHLQRTGVYLIITRCRHVMCTLCSHQLLATSSRCPLCRENVSSTTLMPYCILT